jgi:hypothetical protein
MAARERVGVAVRAGGKEPCSGDGSSTAVGLQKRRIEAWSGGVISSVPPSLTKRNAPVFPCSTAIITSRAGHELRLGLATDLPCCQHLGRCWPNPDSPLPGLNLDRWPFVNMGLLSQATIERFDHQLVS